jgi:hypothetical protein
MPLAGKYRGAFKSGFSLFCTVDNDYWNAVNNSFLSFQCLFEWSFKFFELIAGQFPHAVL